jgi:hypothetical protein
MTKFLRILFLILFSSVKFFLVPPIAILQYKYTVVESIIFTTVGGSIGVFVFYFLSKELLIAWLFLKTIFSKKHRNRHKHNHKPTQTIFTQNSRRMVMLKQKWGLYGLVILTPCLLSIPLGTFIAARFYPGKHTIFLLCSSVILWSVILNCAIFFFQTSF